MRRKKNKSDLGKKVDRFVKKIVAQHRKNGFQTVMIQSMGWRDLYFN